MTMDTTITPPSAQLWTEAIVATQHACALWLRVINLSLIPAIRAAAFRLAPLARAAVLRGSRAANTGTAAV